MPIQSNKAGGTVTETDPIYSADKPNIAFKDYVTNAISQIPTLQEQFTLVVDGGGGVISTGIKKDFTIPFNCTITGWSLFSNDGTTGSITIDIWKTNYNNFPATVANTITGSAKPSISSLTKNTSTALTGWTISLTKGDILRYNVDSITNLKSITLFLQVQRQ